MIKKDKRYIARTVSWQDAVQVSICDSEVFGQTVKGDGLEINVSREYFGGDMVDTEGALNLVRSSSVANLVGNNIVGAVIDAELASDMAVRKIGGTAFLLIFKFQG
ncbi:MAG: DUF424 family protein [Thaumarchaeota archaeon]|nr:DUF424 family protein [Nitrososphaerota archaeon]